MRKLFKNIFLHQRLLFDLTKRDLTSAYTGSVIGSLWVIVDPLIYIILTLLFFQFAIKGGNTDGAPYVAWVLPAIILWTFISTVLNSSTNTVREYGYLMRHGNFDLRLLAIIKILSASFVHIVLMAVLIFTIVIFLDIHISWRFLGLTYYFFAICCLLISMAWAFSALGVFWKDVRNLVSIFLQLEFWVSPIFWEPERFPKVIAMIMYVNPFYYPIHGYRISMLSVDFGEHFWVMTLYFWCAVITMLWLSSRIFNKFSKDFGDAL